MTLFLKWTYTKSMHIKSSIYIHHHSYVIPKNLLYWWDSNPSLMFLTRMRRPRRQGIQKYYTCKKLVLECNFDTSVDRRNFRWNEGWPNWSNFRILGRLLTSGSCFENFRSSPILWASYFLQLSYVIGLTKNGLGHILGDFFTNVSVYPGETYLCSTAAKLWRFQTEIQTPSQILRLLNLQLQRQCWSRLERFFQSE
jgi:hypothetical protein